MGTIIKAFVIIVSIPFAFCLGVYGCTAVHVAANSSPIHADKPVPVSAPIGPTGR